MPQVGIIGGADGPTAIFLTSVGPQWVNWAGVIFVLMLLLPNMLYLLKGAPQAPCKNKALEIVEQIGRYGCMFLMVLGPAIRNVGYVSLSGLIVYLFGNLALILAYWICWLFYFRQERKGLALALALLPVGLFLLSGFACHDYLLAILALIFGVSHVCITLQRSFDL